MNARLQALAAVVFWGISFVATKAALREISPLALIVMRFTLGVGLLWGLMLAREGKVRLPRSEVPVLVAMGLVGVFIHQMLQAHGLRLTSAVSTGWLIGVTPIWSAVLAAAVLRERFGWMKTAGLLIGFIGATLVISQGQFSRSIFTLPSTKGDLLILASTINWAIFSIIGTGVIKRLGPLRATAAMMLFGWLMLLPFFAAAKDWREYARLSPPGWTAVLFLGLACSGLGYLFWYGALEHIEPSRVASFLYIEPLVTLAAAVVLLGEPVRALTVGGGLLVLAGVVVVQRAP